jgi:hypothetical protein
MPNEIPGNAGFLVHTNMAPVIAGVTGAATTLGRGMLPNTAVPLLEGGVMQVWGRGTWDLDEPNVPPLDVRFTRGPRLHGRSGTIDVRLVLGGDGTARTVCYLTDNPEAPENILAIRLDSQNRPILTLNAGVIMPVAATGVLSFSANATNTEDFTLDTKTYTFEAGPLTDVDGNVLIGATELETLRNLIAAINLEPWGAGVVYAASMTANPAVRAAPGVGNSMAATSVQVGSAGNAIATTENLLSGQWDNGATMVGGDNGDLADIASVTQSGSNFDPGQPMHLRLTWDSENMISGVHRHMSFSINGEPLAVAKWSTDPITPWASWQPTHLVLAAGLEHLYLEADFNGTLQGVQVSNLVLP